MRLHFTFRIHVDVHTPHPLAPLRTLTSTSRFHLNLTLPHNSTQYVNYCRASSHVVWGYVLFTKGDSRVHKVPYGLMEGPKARNNVGVKVVRRCRPLHAR
jgi:hypothetical protein